jgi:uncharacterized OB-fold protein
MTNTEQLSPRVAIREDLLSYPLTDLAQVRLVGSACEHCREVFFGKASVCANCGAPDPQARPLSDRGTLWTYTVIRHKPPGDYKGPEPFVPFAIGLVQIPDGLRVLAPIACDLRELRIGLPLQFRAFVRPGSHDPEVVSFEFAPVQ